MPRPAGVSQRSRGSKYFMGPPPWPSRCGPRAGLSPARPRPSRPEPQWPRREAQAAAWVPRPDPGGFAVSLSREAPVLALAGRAGAGAGPGVRAEARAGAGVRTGDGVRARPRAGARGRKTLRPFGLFPWRLQVASSQKRGGSSSKELGQREGGRNHSPKVMETEWPLTKRL